MLEIKSVPPKGKGVFAGKSFKKGEIVLVGKIEKELSENHSHASQIGLTRFILHNEVYRLVNHSCDPNCGIKVNATEAHNFVARRPISKGEEITFDYAMENYTIDHFPLSCQCGSEQCREKITGWKDIPESRKEEYRGWAAPYLFVADRSMDKALK